jgi:hypothetical protein
LSHDPTDDRREASCERLVCQLAERRAEALAEAADLDNALRPARSVRGESNHVAGYALLIPPRALALSAGADSRASIAKARELREGAADSLRPLCC